MSLQKRRVDEFYRVTTARYLNDVFPSVICWRMKGCDLLVSVRAQRWLCALDVCVILI